ncbi:MAG TPA: cellulase family glycosylhydrolase [Tepidisphaeraceae bacterium]|jgi:hypothetical protein|nr:cellulase family glycosylhydrolase [Tepidisphaeraceae bacterium]
MLVPCVVFLAVFPTLCVLADLPRIRVSDDARGFVESKSNKPFIPFGFNYDRDYRMRLIEDYWEKEWDTVAGDFEEMKSLGANVVRVHLQFGKFMDAADRPNAASLAQLGKLLALCEKIQIRLDITGLASYRKSDTPKWYDALDEEHRWRAQANFWAAIARTCANSDAVFFYDLINEPIVPDGKIDYWMTGHLVDFDYCQYITLDSHGRNRDEISRQWTRRMVQAIRKHDANHLISIGLLPNDQEKFGEGGFSTKSTAPEVDFLCTHLYPDAKNLDESLRILKGFERGKPVIIEEMFPITCSADQLLEFMKKSGGHAAGWISFYWGQTPDELKESEAIGDALVRNWLVKFTSARPGSAGGL